MASIGVVSPVEVQHPVSFSSDEVRSLKEIIQRASALLQRAHTGNCGHLAPNENATTSCGNNTENFEKDDGQVREGQVKEGDLKIAENATGYRAISASLFPCQPLNPTGNGAECMSAEYAANTSQNCGSSTGNRCTSSTASSMGCESQHNESRQRKEKSTSPRLSSRSHSHGKFIIQRNSRSSCRRKNRTKRSAETIRNGDNRELTPCPFEINEDGDSDNDCGRTHESSDSDDDYDRVDLHISKRCSTWYRSDMRKYTLATCVPVFLQRASRIAASFSLLISFILQALMITVLSILDNVPRKMDLSNKEVTIVMIVLEFVNLLLVLYGSVCLTRQFFHRQNINNILLAQSFLSSIILFAGIYTVSYRMYRHGWKLHSFGNITDPEEVAPVQVAELYAKMLYLSTSTGTLCGASTIYPEQWYNFLFLSFQMILSFLYFTSIVTQTVGLIPSSNTSDPSASPRQEDGSGEHTA